MTTRLQEEPQHIRHAVHFYDGDEELVGTVGAYLGDRLGRGDPAIVIATASHRAAFEAAMVQAGVDVARVRAGGLLILLDAAEILDRFMVSGRPDKDAFDGSVGALVRRLGGAGRSPAAYGEMVALLWEQGNVTGALELEELWNALLEQERFSLLCAYPHSILGDSATAGIDDICRAHSEVVGVGLDRGSREARRTFPCSAESPRAARHFAQEFLGSRYEDEIVETAALIVTELATNAVLHAGSAFEVAVSCSAHGVRIRVFDRSAAPATLGASASSAESGRGIAVVQALASAWGTEPVDGGKVVWVELVGSAR